MTDLAAGTNLAAVFDRHTGQSLGMRDAPPQRSTRHCLIIKQDNNGDTFVISANPLAWAEARCVRVEDVHPRHIGAFTHPTAEEIREAMSDLLPGPRRGRRRNTPRLRHLLAAQSSCRAATPGLGG
jgi:hypothetical protein